MKFPLAFIAPRRFDCADFIGRPVYYGRNELPSRMTEPEPRPPPLPARRRADVAARVTGLKVDEIRRRGTEERERERVRTISPA